MDEELQKVLAHIVYQIHLISTGLKNVLDGLENLSKKEEVSISKLSQDNDHLNRRMREDLGELIGENHKIIQMLKKLDE